MNTDLEGVKRDVAAANRVLANLGLARRPDCRPRARQYACSLGAQPFLRQGSRI